VAMARSSAVPQLAKKSPSLFADWLLLAGFCSFLFFFGLAQFGLVGADEPRYAQVAREMFERHDWITPTLAGKPWLEKPVLYYWEAIISYHFFGVSDWAARIPSAFDASLLVCAAYLFLKRFRPGFALDGALMMASAAGMIGFARAAATDMPLASMYAIAMLAWYAWYEGGSKVHLSLFYMFMGLATLAKGPVAVLLSILIVGLFILAKGEYRLIWRTLWIPGILLFSVVALPWYIAVQMRNPEFFRVFILEHNLARFGTNLYHHPQPFWYYLPVALLGLMPWTVFVIVAVTRVLREWWQHKREFLASGDALNAFLAMWLIVFILFFSTSQSKLPGYILPAMPAGALLVAEYLRRQLTTDQRESSIVIVLHSMVASLPIIPALMIYYLLTAHHLPWNTGTLVSSVVAMVLAIAIGLTLRSHYGLRMLRFVSLVPVILTITALLKIGAPALDDSLSARPVAQQLRALQNRKIPITLFLASRETEYGLHFYENQPIPRYELNQIPDGEHLVVAPPGCQKGIAKHVAGRRVSYLGSFAPQHLDLFWVAAK
jgi:4-amino-4-deoxy-L-arabinose transferase-like glycosyltransferase